MSLNRDNVFGLKPPVIIKPGQCFSRRIRNSFQETVRVKLYDPLHSQERFTLVVLPG